MLHQTIIVQHTQAGIATITLNRPSLHNAFNEQLIQELLDALDYLANNKAIRAIILMANGKHFSAGADLHWMQRLANATEAENLADAMQLARLMQQLYFFPKPSIALVNGAAIGGGAGLVACCDIAIATNTAKFAFSEVKLGLIPAVISPYIIAAIGKRQAQRYFLTAETFTADIAYDMQLVHIVCDENNLINQGQHFAQLIVQNGPCALQAAKRLLHDIAYRTIDSQLIIDTAERITKIRTSAESHEGIRAFLEKRTPQWNKG